MARPKKGQEKKRTEGIALRVTETMKQQIDALAAANDRTISDEVIIALERHIAGANVKPKARR